MRLPAAEWRERRDRHVARLRPHVDEVHARRAAGVRHPVWDFLFEYYSYRPAYLLRWSPGPGVVLEDAGPGDAGWGEFVPVAGGMVLPAAFPARRVPFLEWAASYLEGIAARPALFGCFGLHEWAMLYRTDEVRHAAVPLRLAADDLAKVVESAALVCTHYDAFRFFTPPAVPLNKHRLTRAATAALDQRGCVHVTIDLYRYAAKLAPFGRGEVLAEAFELARSARELDMAPVPTICKLSASSRSASRQPTAERSTPPGSGSWPRGRSRSARTSSPTTAACSTCSRIQQSRRHVRVMNSPPAPGRREGSKDLIQVGHSLPRGAATGGRASRASIDNNSLSMNDLSRLAGPNSAAARSLLLWNRTEVANAGLAG